MFRFQYPELALLALPVGWLFFRYGWTRGVTGWVRLVVLSLLLFALTGPQFNVGGDGVDVMVVVDRSRSLPGGGAESIRELVENLQENRGEADRVGIVTFGTETQIEQELSRTKTREAFERPVGSDGSDLNEALLKAINLIDPDRPARILVLSDGEAGGASPLSAARRARELEIPIDYRTFERIRFGDVAIDSVLMPEEVAVNEPFQYAVWVHADREAEGTLTVSRETNLLETRPIRLRPGLNRFIFTDLLTDAGFLTYEAKLDIERDPIRENNRGLGVVRVEAGPKVLVLSADGKASRLTRTLAAAGIAHDISEAKAHPLTQDALDPYRAVILENSPAESLGRVKMERLAQFVEDLGGGLLMTGGEYAFGAGGYYNSPLDPLLPVSMELREEDRKLQIAIAIAMDNSGSMGVEVPGTSMMKMDLANLGASEVVKMLSPADKLAVMSVDSTPTVVQRMETVEDPQAIISRVRNIGIGGGGIFIYNALVGAGNELEKATEYATRHIILFADASDSVREEGYRELLKRYTDEGITVSVIGLGTEADPFAPLLRDIAARGNGNVLFTNDPQELPRLFSQETMSVAKGTFIKADPDTQPQGIAGKLRDELAELGGVPTEPIPNVGGYNRVYSKSNAYLGAVSVDEYNAPWFAFWYRGLGRVAALTLEVDGQYSGEFASWSEYEEFLVTQLRWLLGGKNPNEVYLELNRRGQDAVIRVELDPQRQDAADEPPELLVVPPGEEREEIITPDFVWTGANSLEARFALDRIGSYRTLVKTGEREFTRGPAIALPYSPEFVPRIGLPTGPEVLASIADISGGVERTNVLEVFRDPPKSSRSLFLLPWLVLASLLLLLLEIAGRRLSLWDLLFRKEAETLETVARQKETRPMRSRFRFGRQGPSRAEELKREAEERDREARNAERRAAEEVASRKKAIFLRAKDRAKQRRDNP